MTTSERGCVVVVTGLSGAGKSTALHALEDLGYYCIDNLPTPVAKHTVEVCEQSQIVRVGLGIDARVGSFLDGAPDALAQIAGSPREVIVLFLDASDEALLRRFSETRRPHPLSVAGGRQRAPLDVLESIQIERQRLAPLRAAASIELDTSTLSVHDLRRRVIAHLGPGRAEQPRIQTRFVTFGFKYGLPIDANLVLDVRFLDNPYFVPNLRPLSGMDHEVKRFLLEREDAKDFLARTEDLLGFLLPRYEAEGKSYLTVAIGCTGGRHRSVVIAIELAERLQQRTGLQVSVVHRDVARTDTMAVEAHKGGSTR